MPAQSKFVAERSTSFIMKLPSELLTAVLTSVEDWDTLKAVIITCKLLYATFQSGPGTATAFLQKIEPNLIMPYIVHDHCLRYRPGEWDEMKIFREPKQLRIMTSKHWTGRDVARMCETFRLLSELSDWILDKMADEFGENAHTVKPYSSTVKYRALKACYRIEMLRVCLQPRFTVVSRVWPDFKNLLVAAPPWVNEQMYSVFEVVEEAISIAIDDLKLDVENAGLESWRPQVVQWAQEIADVGLLSVKQFLEANTASQKLKVMQARDRGNGISFQSMLNLCCFLQDVWLGDSDSSIRLIQSTRAHLTGQIPSREWDISQYKPYSVARTLLHADERMQQIFSRGVRGFRVSGYVMWDLQNSREWLFSHFLAGLGI